LANILVTGAAGFIGSHVCKALQKRGHIAIGFDDLSRGHLKAVKFGPFTKGRLHEFDKLKNTLIEYDVEAVIHLAAFAYVEESTRFPEIYFENNINGTYWLLEAMSASNTRNIVFSSSCAVYGEALTDQITEDHPTCPINPYGLSKLLCEKLIENQREINDFQTCSLRYFNVAGSDLEGELGENHEPEPHIIPNLIIAAMQGREFPIYGTDYPTHDGSCIRDYIHVWDLALAHVLSVEGLLNRQKLNSIYNLGNNRGISVLELVRFAEKNLNKEIRVKIERRRPGDPAKLIASSHAFQQDTGWKAKHSDPESLLSSTAHWLQKKS